MFDSPVGKNLVRYLEEEGLLYTIIFLVCTV